MDLVEDNVSVDAPAAIFEHDAADLPFLGKLPERVRERLLTSATVERLTPRQKLFGVGAVPTHLHILLAGMVELACDYDGRDCTALMMASGDVLMPAAVLPSELYLVSARALTAAKVMAIDAAVIREEARTSAELALALAGLMSGQWRVALKIILDLKCRSPSQRLAAFLLRLHDTAAANTRAELPFSKRQLASRIGMQPETLSRTLQTLTANGLYLRGREIIVTNRDAAQRFCGPDPYPSATENELGVHAL